MFKWLIFSNKIHKIKKHFSFFIIVLIRFIRIIFSSKKDIEEIYFNSPLKKVFRNGNVIIDFYFKNVLWYEIKGVYKTTNHQSLSLNPLVIKFPIEFIVYGVNSKKSYTIDLKYENSYNFNDFNISIKKIDCSLDIINDIFKNIKKIKSKYRIHLFSNKIELKTNDLEITNNKINIQFTNFNQNDYI